ncbi:DEAD-domain-containing protein [Perkinsela sp. CCAP 1560/4]|nr:DEAD-domain-containing protein [Perkinsela sp. CCAP 1560/4]|eukprot:KNH09413.1 DEAD-domain-containing protein [Perkinsela sp. CCAP 1560/4]
MRSERGIVYFSSIPNGVNPINLQLFLTSLCGEIGRIFLTPENESSAFSSADRNSKFKKRYKDGYVEFRRKEDAIFAADRLNMQSCDILGRRHRSHGQLWNVCFMPDLRWESIIEQKEAVRVSRSNRLKARKKVLRDQNTAYYAKALKKLGSIVGEERLG